MIVISPKAPSSKQKDVFDNVEKFLEEKGRDSAIAIKIPVFNDEDFEFALKYYDLIAKYPFVNVKLYLSVGNTNTTEGGSIALRVLKDYTDLINKTMDSRMKNVYILPQVHTLVWGNKQGV